MNPPESGDDTGPLTVEAAVELARGLWAGGDDPRTHQTVLRMAEIATRFARRLHVLGIDTLDQVTPSQCEEFIYARSRTAAVASISTMRFRRTTLRALFKTLRMNGIDVVDPTADLALPPRPDTTARPLTTDEVVFCRTCTKAARSKDLRRPAAWALAEATAVTSEQAAVTVGHLDDPERPTSVTLPGTRRIRPRVVELTGWARSILQARVAELADPRPQTRLVYGGTQHPDSVAAQAAACNLVTNILAAAGLSGEPGVRPASVRHWRARLLFEETGRIEDVANLLGHRSLDEAAEAIGFDWRR